MMTRSPKTSQNKHLTCLRGGKRKTSNPSIPPIPKPPENAIATPEASNPEEFTINLQQLEEKASQIARLSAELEKAIAEFQNIGDRVDLSSVNFRKNLGHHWFPERICSYGEVKVPQIHQTEKGVLVLSSRRVQLPQTPHFETQPNKQQDANLIAHLLRQRNFTKQSIVDRSDC